MPPPLRPASLKELDFPRRKPVQWFSPPTLARSAAKVILAAAFGDYLDKRELQESLDQGVVANEKKSPEVWLDFVADTGDGFNPTYSVAWCVSQRTLTIEGLLEPLPRADYLIFGGDEVYPYATAKEYEERMRGPYKAALPWTSDSPGAPNPRVLATPGNHDWYDGLTGFMRVFSWPGWIGGRERIQTRSYYALALPGPFWLWGIDIGTDAYVDMAQATYFKHVAEQMRPDDRLIICTAKPSWADLAEEPDAYRNLSFVERNLVPAHVKTVLMISGDKHHYARYEAANDTDDDQKRMKITAGGGGAFLSSTHNLKDVVEVPISAPPTPTTVEKEEKEPFELRHEYPEKKTSRRLTLLVLTLGLRNSWFAVIPGLLYAMWYIAAAGESRDGDHHRPGVVEFATGGDGTAVFAIFLIVWALLAGFISVPKSYTGLQSGVLRSVFGGVHAIAHFFAFASISSVIVWQVGQLPLVVGAFIAFVLGAVAGSLVLSVFLGVVFTLFGWNETETFSAFRHEGYKNFLRIHVTQDRVTIYPVGIDKTSKNWEVTELPAKPRGDESWLRPAKPLAPHLIEGPLTIR